MYACRPMYVRFMYEMSKPRTDQFNEKIIKRRNLLNYFGTSKVLRVVNFTWLFTMLWFVTLSRHGWEILQSAISLFYISVCMSARSPKILPRRRQCHTLCTSGCMFLHVMAQTEYKMVRLPTNGLCGFYPARRYPSAVGQLVLFVCPSICPTICLSQVGVLLRRLNLGSRKQRCTIAREM